MSAELKASMQRRMLPAKGLDFFPTPPWATRAFLAEWLAPRCSEIKDMTAWEPAAGEGHMLAVLDEFFGAVYGSDVEDYGKGFRVGSFVGKGPDVVPSCPYDWVITNPPFNLATEFLERGLREASLGVALLLRTSWLEGAERYLRVFAKTPPSDVVQYAERVPMVAGRYDPSAASATSYAWFVWNKAISTAGATHLTWIEPGAKVRNFRETDVTRWAK